MSARKPVRLLASGLTGRVYAVTSYDEKSDGRIVAKTKHDVTADIDALLTAERERIAQAVMDDADDPDCGWAFIRRHRAAFLARNP